jgi:hypothetical protein
VKEPDQTKAQLRKRRRHARRISPPRWWPLAVASHLTVRASDIRRNAVRSKHIKRHQVQASDLAKILAGTESSR